MYDGGKIDLTNYSSSLLTNFSPSSELPIIGSSLADTILMEYVDRLTLTGAFTFVMGDGDDLLPRARLINTDSIDLGSGNDNIELQIGRSGTPVFDSVNYSKLDGGAGNDTLDFTNSDTNETNGKTLTLTFGGATNFENIVGAGVPETLQGDSNNNILQSSLFFPSLYSPPKASSSIISSDNHLMNCTFANLLK